MAKSSPLVADSDGDGISDGAYGLNPLDPSDAALDSDGDGVSNLQEAIAGTNPNDPTDGNILLFHARNISRIGTMGLMDPPGTEATLENAGPYRLKVPPGIRIYLTSNPTNMDWITDVSIVLNSTNEFSGVSLKFLNSFSLTQDVFPR